MATLRDISALMKGLCEPIGVSYAVQRVRTSAESALLAHDEAQHLLGTERLHSATLRAFKRRAEFCAGRIAARQALVGLSPQFLLLEIGRNAWGAPVLRTPWHPQPSTSELGVRELSAAFSAHVSISHSNGFAVAVAAPWHVGVDLEANEARPSAFARYFLCEGEQRALNQLEGDAMQSAINRFWTRKESACKVGGWGARLPLRAIDTSLHEVRIDPYSIEWSSGVFAGFAASVAFASDPADRALALPATYIPRLESES